MKITPLDIQQQQFKGKMLGGIDPEDVDSFLQLVAQEMEGLIRENTDLREQCRKAAADAEQTARQERELREAMLAAQKITEEMKANAQKEASLIVSEAEVKAEKILVDAERRLGQLNEQLQDLRRQKLQFESAFKALLDTHYKMISLEDA
ncbi:DivIVA domain-containing protein [Geobacter sulfurreducens]|jgi:cell division initiation protein|uniref:Cell division protein DivIVA, putative n=3 Tax=Geobacter TaxID=28231 RepID=Q74EU4_GEOSL|nr:MULTISPECIES: DivIVA domain-containing protein [Geobacter]AAR34195.1 cell division protein DivIVA, putative [Geobacter sulfurreducens PCA]ADI83709.1 cell division protein DivIVA, putative [Geobacter sulfurreducens KN400]AJY70605.1 cell division protein DivIVA [Geobacter sulfurreducens]ANA40925.1 cell division protein DivIVA [Geobacter anodireducens]KIE43027.1 cell division protein DivIVA [Geobacter soli]